MDFGAFFAFFVPIMAITLLAMYTLPMLGESTRDSVLIQGPADSILTALRGWASQNDFVETAAGAVITFKRGQGFLVAPTYMEVTQVAGGVKIDTYITIPAFKRREVALTDSTWWGKVPRKKFLERFNELLAVLNHPPIAAR